jgi:hypothetical protein
MTQWSWMSIDSPWMVLDKRRNEFRQHGNASRGMQVFDTAREARADLQRVLDEGGAGVGDDKYRSAALLRAMGEDGELMMWNMEPPSAWIIFEMPTGVSPFGAGVSTYTEWKPHAYRVFMDSLAGLTQEQFNREHQKPGIWFPRASRRSADGSGKSSASAASSGGCLLVVCALIVSLLVLIVR